MRFSEFNLNKGLFQALEDLGFDTATHIQVASFSTIMSGRDVIGIAQTGTGKTLAFLLPLLRLWKFRKDRHPQIIIVVPTRELVAQVVEATESLTGYMNVQTVGVYGGTNIRNQVAAVEAGLDVIVGTPGRLMDLALKGALNLKYCKKLVIDEVDEMLNLGFRHQLTMLLDLLPNKRQNLLFSATMTDEVHDLIHTFFNNPEVIEAAPSGTPLENITQVSYTIPNFKSKLSLLHSILKDEAIFNRVMIFASTKKLADILYEAMRINYEDQIGIIHSNKSQNQRFNSVIAFKAGEIRVLIATDIISRGIDIDNVSHVINFDMPDNPEKYMHRIGRTGRAEEKGTAISFITESDQLVLQQIEVLMDQQVPIAELPEEVELTEELIPYEVPDIKMKNQLTKAPTIAKNLKGDAVKQSKSNNKKVLTRKAKIKAKRAKKIKKC